VLQFRDPRTKLRLFCLCRSQMLPKVRDLPAAAAQGQERRAVEAQTVQVEGTYLREREDPPVRIFA
jgi:hypothetical protein